MLAITDLFEQVASVVEPAACSFRLNDPDDEIYLATALAGRAEVLITGNIRHFPAPRYGQSRSFDRRTSSLDTANEADYIQLS